MKHFKLQQINLKANGLRKFTKPLIVIFLFLISSFISYSQNSEWAYNTGGIGLNSGKIVRTDNNGNVYIAGTFQNNITLGDTSLTNSSSTDVFLAKYTVSGKRIWVLQIGGIDDENVYSLCIDLSGNIYIAGLCGNSMTFFNANHTKTISGGGTYIAKYSPNGICLWVYQIGATNNPICNSIYKSGSNIYITGYLKGTTSINFNPKGPVSKNVNGSGGDDIFFAEYDTLFNCSFVKIIGNFNSDEDGISINSDNLGNIYVGGYFSGIDVEFNPGGISKKLSCRGGLGIYDVFLAKYTFTGNCIWAKKIGGTSGDFLKGMIVKDSNIYITGYFSSKPAYFDPADTTIHNLNSLGSNDMFFAKYDTACYYRWAYNIGKNGYSNYGYDISVDIGNNIYLTGVFSGDSVNYNPAGTTYWLSTVSPSKFNIFMAKYNSSGLLHWARRFGSINNGDCGNSITTDSDQNIYLTGNFNGTNVNFGTGSNIINLSSGANNDLFIAKYTDQATHLTFSGAVGSSISASWYNGTGTGGRAVFISEDTTGTAAPVNNITYTASTTFGSVSSEIGSTGWYCVFNSNTGNSVNINGLTEGKKYRVMVCEYDGVPGNEKYKTFKVVGNPANVLLDYASPTIQATNIVFSNLLDTSVTISFTKGNGTKRLVIMSLEDLSGFPAVLNKKTYNANSKFGYGDTVGIVKKRYCVYNDTGNYFTVRKLTANKTYRVTVIEYRGTAGAEAYNNSTAIDNPLNFKTKYNQSISVTSIANKTYGAAEFDPGWTSNLGLPLVYSSSDINIADTSGGKIHIVGAGTCTIYCDQAGNDTVVAAKQVSSSLTILKANLTIAADTITRTYGELNPVLTWKATGLQYDDSIRSVIITCSAISPRANLGDYDINISGAIFAKGKAANYNITYQKGVLKILESPIKICLVTVDLETGYNMIIWERDNKSGLLGYKVCRQTSSEGIYDTIGTVLISKTGIFIDSTSHYDTHVEFYKILTISASAALSRLDQCNYHKTILLQANAPSGGVVPLNWAPYEVENSTMNFRSYVLYKGTDSTKLVVVDTIASNVYNYNDPDPLAQVNKYYYRIAGIKWIPCYPEGTNKAGAGPFSQSVSNMEDNRIQGNDIKVIKDGIRFDLVVVPNPVNRISAIRYILPVNADVKTYVVNILGETVATINVGRQKAGYNQFMLDADKLNLTNGMYFIKVEAGNAHAISKISVVR